MDYQQAKQISLLAELIKSSEILSQEYSGAKVSEDLFVNIRQLCFKDNSFRRSFYTVIQKLGEKYKNIYLTKLNEL